MPGRDGTGPRAVNRATRCKLGLGRCRHGEGRGDATPCLGRGRDRGCFGSLREQRQALQARIDEIDRLLKAE